MPKRRSHTGESKQNEPVVAARPVRKKVATEKVTANLAQAPTPNRRSASVPPTPGRLKLNMGAPPTPSLKLNIGPPARPLPKPKRDVPKAKSNKKKAGTKKSVYTAPEPLLQEKLAGSEEEEKEEGAEPEK
ncbi:hypothetical protein OEA41_003306 [Lepraria neglecta]|uniref:Uncharacterized protein n=1 Tax=Lepraria neglecta TaxID=209136 RepID=A0AAE0DI72_9LECA|nr:hypothetical protein OEA41_003306 [Lepraria neglecta]